MQNNQCSKMIAVYNETKKSQKRLNCCRLALCCPTQVRAGSLRSGVELSPRCLASSLTLLKQHHQSSISCHGPELRSEQIHVNRKGPHLAMCFRSAGQFAGDTVSRDCYPALSSSFSSASDCVDEKVSCDPFIAPPPRPSVPLSPELDHHLPLGS